MKKSGESSLLRYRAISKAWKKLVGAIYMVHIIHVRTVAPSSRTILAQVQGRSGKVNNTKSKTFSSCVGNVRYLQSGEIAFLHSSPWMRIAKRRTCLGLDRILGAMA